MKPSRKYILIFLVIFLLIAVPVGVFVSRGEPEPTPEPTSEPTVAQQADAQPTDIPEPDVAPTEAPAEEETPTTQEVSPLSPLDSPLATEDLTTTGQTLPNPAEGTGVLAGQIYSFIQDAPVIGNGFYLTPAIGEENDLAPTVLTEPVVDEGDIVGITDEQGLFIMEDIPPGNYFLSVWAPYTWYLAQEQGDFDAPPLLITVEADEQLDLGRLYVPWQ